MDKLKHQQQKLPYLYLNWQQTYLQRIHNASLTNTLIVVGPICDENCTVVFKKNDLTVLSPEGQKILTCWGEEKLPRLWRFALKPSHNIITDYTTTNETTPEAHSAYNLTRI